MIPTNQLPDYTLTPNSGGWNCPSADGKIEVYGRTQEEAIWNCGVAVGAGMLAAEKLRADAFRHALKQCADLDENDPEADPCDCIICREGRELLARTPEEWAALALSGKEQSNG